MSQQTTNENVLNLKELTKAKLGILGSARDDLIEAIIEGIKTELKDFNSIDYTEGDNTIAMFVSELASWRYQNPGNPSMPPYLQLWLNNLIVRGLKNESEKDI